MSSLPLSPAAGARAAVSWATELTRIATGTSQLAPDPRDRRFSDPAWTSNPGYRRLAQTYLAACEALDGYVADLEAEGQRGAAETARLLSSLGTSAFAPTNTLIGNPAALKRAIDTGGISLLRGAMNMVADIRHTAGLPATVERDQLLAGRDLALTPGDVVQRDPVAELLRYTPTTREVRSRPVLVVPPMIGRYYFLDLRPGRSFVEYSVAQGLQTYMLSWRSPTPAQQDWDVDTYVGRIESAIEEIRALTGSDDVNVVGFCAGGMLASLAMARQAANGTRAIHSGSFAVTMLDFGDPMPLRALTPDWSLRALRGLAHRRGIHSASALGRGFTWLRPQDLVWTYWVNNYLMGQPPPEFDILSWNADGVHLPAGLFSQFIDVMLHNTLARRATFKVLGTSIDLEKIEVDTFVAGALTDHLTPWRTTYQTTQLMRGASTYALSSSGHIASLVNPPGNPRASYELGPTHLGQDADAWRESATSHTGSWWEAWAEWMGERSGEWRVASNIEPSSDPAPGRYVRERVRPRAPKRTDPNTTVTRSGLAYRVQGQGPALLWLSGYNAPSALLQPLVDRFSEDFTCITFDFRGCGETELPVGGLSMRAMASDAVEVLDTVGLGPAHVLGFSLGGMVAQELALQAPDRVRSLVLASTTAGGWSAAYAPPPIEMGVELTRIASRLGSWKIDLSVAFAQAWAAGTHDTTGRLARIMAPTLVVHGEQDRLLLVSNADVLASGIPDAELLRLDGESHLFFLDSDRGMDRIVAWLEHRRDAMPPADAEPAPLSLAQTAATQVMPPIRVLTGMQMRARQGLGLLRRLW